MAWRVREIEPGSSKAVVELEGVVDSTNLEDFFTFVNSVFKQGFDRIVVDMEYASYLSSGGLSVIIDAYKKAEKLGGKLIVARATDMVRELFEVSQLDKILDFYDTLDEAIKALET
jgi:stage II sporulation protein AA (anti-sigma F factor antagonist)